MIIIYDSKETNFNNNGLGTLNPSLCTITEITNSEYSLSLRHGFDANNKWKLIETDRVIKAKGQYFRIAKVQETLTEIVAYAIHIFYDLNKNFIEDINIVDKTGSQALSHILSSTVYPHNFTASSDITKITGSRLVRKNVVQCLLSDDENSFLNRWGGEIKRDNFSFSINLINGNDNGVNINYGKNLTGLTATFDFSDVITKIIPIAYDGILLPEKYVDSPLIDNYSSPIIREVKFEDVKYKYSPNNSSEEGFETLNEVYAELRRLSNLMYSEQRVDIPSSTYDVNFVELSKTDQYKNYRQLETVEIGDYVRVFWEKTNINIKARCVSYVYDVLRDRYESIKLGSYSESLFSNINTTIKNNSVTETIVTDLINVSLEDAVDKVTILIQNGLGGYVVKTRDELLIMDTDDIETATFVWRWNINGLGFSSTGYNGTYGLAMTHDGQIVADKITAGELNGEIIRGNSISVNKLEVEAVRKIESAQSEEDVRTILSVELGSFGLSIENNITERLGDYYTKTEANSTIQANAKSIALEVSEEKVSGLRDEVNDTLGSYPTTIDMNSAILLKANEITSTVEVTKTSGVELIPQTYTINSTSGFYATTGTVKVNQYGLYSKEKTFIKSQLIAIDRTKPIYCKYDFTTVGTGTTHIGFEQYDCDGLSIGENDSTLYWVSKTNHTGWATGDYTLPANTLNTDTRYVKLRILINWSASADFQYTQFKILSALQLQSRSASTQIAQMSDKIENKVDSNGVKTIIQQNPESVRIGFNAISNYFDLTAQRLQVGHSDSSYSQIGQNGILHVIGETSRKYHSLMVAGTVAATDSWGQITITITLPSEFKGKSFNVLPSLVHVGFDRGVAHAFKNLNISTHDFDYVNGRFALTCSPIGVDVTGAYTVNASTVRVSYIAIA